MNGISEAIGQELIRRRQQLIACAISERSGLQWCRNYSEFADDPVRVAFASAMADVPHPPAISVVATGGYGRQELAPHSDIDLTVIPLDEAHPDHDRIIRKLYDALDHIFATVLRLKVGYAYRLMVDVPGLDATTRSGLFDARWVAGATGPYEALRRALFERFPVGEFLLEKLRERKLAEAKFGDTPLAVELHLKESAGGLRSWHAANWLRQAIGELPLNPTAALDRMLWRRNALHAVSDRQMDLLTRAKQAEIADTIGQNVFDFGSETCLDALELHAAFRDSLERVQNGRFSVAIGVSAHRGELQIEPNSRLSEAAAGVAIGVQLGLAIQHIRVQTDGKVFGPEALFAISQGTKTLEALDRSSLLEQLLPEFTACRTLMPHDSAHCYSVFEHTLRAVREMELIESTSPFYALKMGLKSLAPLTLGILLHDAGKIKTDKPHSEAGADLAKKLVKRWNISDSTGALVVWLVRHHLDMAKMIRMRDISHPATAAELAKLVKDRERLDCLTLLTYCDIRAVSPDAWTPSQESFLLELHARTAEHLDARSDSVAPAESYRQRLRAALPSGESSHESVEAFLGRLPAHYIMSTTPEALRLHVKMAEVAASEGIAVDFEPRQDLGWTDITICCPDRAGLLSEILAAIYAHELVINGIRAATATGSPALALDVFSVSFRNGSIPAATARSLDANLRAVLERRISGDELLRRSGKNPHQPQTMLTVQFHPGTPAILEVRAPRGRGMAYRLSRMIAEQGWNILAARLGQWAGQGAASFYLDVPAETNLLPQDVEAALAAKV